MGWLRVSKSYHQEPPGRRQKQYERVSDGEYANPPMFSANEVFVTDLLRSPCHAGEAASGCGVAAAAHRLDKAITVRSSTNT